MNTVGLLICTLISENQGLKKSRSISNPRKISGYANLVFFHVSTLKKSWVYTINLKNIKVPNLKKKSRSAGTEIFLGFEIDLDISRP